MEKGDFMGKLTTIAILMAALAVAGCTRSTNALRINTQSPPQPLPAAPSGVVEGQQLDPISGDALAQSNLDANGQPLPLDAPTVGGTEIPTDGTQTASLDPATTATAAPLTHESLAGAWNVTTDNPDCRVFLSFTQWSGGYRAGTRRCLNSELSSVTAWDVKGSQVVLVDSNGAQVASLGSIGTEQYSGQTVSGKPVSFTR
ncbi:MAG: protease inhibitor Inh/omp19 family protein [Pseudomonadota bacterium]